MVEHFQFLVRHLAKRLEGPSRGVKGQRTVQDHPMLGGMVLGGIGPKIIELKMNKVRTGAPSETVVGNCKRCRFIEEKLPTYGRHCLAHCGDAAKASAREDRPRPEAPHQEHSNREVVHTARKGAPITAHSDRESRSIIGVSCHPPIPSSSFLNQRERIEKVRGHMVQKP